MDQKKPNLAGTYHILLKENLSRPIGDWFGEIGIVPQEDGKTLLIGQFADQAALRGFINQLWNLNLTILSVERIKDEDPV